MSIETTLAERGNRYGDFTDHAQIAQDLQECMRDSGGWHALNKVQAQALTVIADKIARILSGDPNYADNWHDIQGYAKLVEDRLPKDSGRHPMTPNVIEPASQMQDDSPRMAAIGQNGNGGEHYIDPVAKRYRWQYAPDWAEWLAMDKDGKWCFFECKPVIKGDIWIEPSEDGKVQVVTFPPVKAWAVSLEPRL